MTDKNKILSDFGEKAIVKKILSMLNPCDFVFGGFGHDSVAISLGKSSSLIVLKIDRGVKTFDIKYGISSYYNYGKFAVLASTSDLIASGAIPKCVLISISIPRNFIYDDLEKIIKGAQETANSYGVFLIGGDTKESKKEENIVAAALGITKKDTYLTRSGANVGDIVALTGSLGGFISAALMVMNKGVKPNKKNSDLFTQMLNPRLAMIEANIVRKMKAASSAMDLSDGLSDALHSISKSSKIGLRIDLDAIPYNDNVNYVSKLFNLPKINFAFSTGDWNILYTIKCNKWDALSNKILRAGGQITKIGVVTKKKNITGKIGKKKGDIAKIANESFGIYLENPKQYIDNLFNTKIII